MSTITITEQQFRDLEFRIVEADWIDTEIGETPTYISDTEYGEVEKTPGRGSFAAGGITYRADWQGEAIDIIRPIEAHTPEHRSHSDLYEWVVDDSDNVSPELETSVQLLDEDGDPLSTREVRDLLDAALDDIDYDLSSVMPALPERPEAESIDIDEGTDMETITLTRDDGPDARFTGEKIASASSHHYDGTRSARWTELDLYRTAKGTLICHEIGKTLWVGETTRYSVHIADDSESLVDQVGHGRLAKELYDEAGIDHAQVIE